MAGRPKKKPEYNPELQFNNFLQELRDAYEEADSLRSLADELNISLLKLRKLLITADVFTSDICTEIKDNNDDNALIQGTWEIDTGSGAGYKFVDDKFMWLKTIENVNDNYWYGDVEYYNGAEAMDIAGLTEEELKSSLPGLKPENIFVTKIDPEKIITDGEDKTATNMNDQTLWTRLWLIEENEDSVAAVVFDLETFSMESYTKVK